MYHIFHDVFIKAPSAKVFDAISQAEHLNNWWTLKCSSDPKLGGEYNLYFTPEYDWFAEATTFEPNTSFHLKMTKSDADWDPTTFGFELLEQDGGTMVQFFHKNWPENNHHFRRSSYCWALLLNGLKQYLENSVIIPFEKRA